MEAVKIMLLATLLGGIECARILVIPVKNNSHLMEMTGITRPLIERGHEVFVLLKEDESLPKALLPTHKRVSFKVLHRLEFEELEGQHFLEVVRDGKEDFSAMASVIQTYCLNMMSDSEMFAELKRLNFDLVIVDNFLVPCIFLVPYILGKPFVAAGTPVSGWLLRLPVLPSVVEQELDLGLSSFCAESSSQGSFMRRLCRTLSYVATQQFIILQDESYLHQFVDFPSIAEIRENASLTLVNRDPLMSSPLPKLPHVEYVGGITTQPAKPLTGELKLWADHAEMLVVVSFGSRFDSLPDDLLAKMLDAFSRTPYSYVFRQTQSQSDKSLQVPDNVRMMDWLPQNDLLGHNHTRLFITHSGNNGQFEALYHGVPMLAFYIHADQKGNAHRITKRGYGLMMNLFDFTADQLVANVQQLVQSPNYSQRIKTASRVFHSAKHPSLRAADAVEHVLKYGGQHLRPVEAYKLTWWQYYMFDVLLLLYVTLLAVLLLVYEVTKCTLRYLFCAKSNYAKTKTD